MPDRYLVRRRTAIAGALGGLVAGALAGGCDTGDDLTPPRGDSSPSPTAGSASPDQRTHDEVLVDVVLDELTSAVALLTSARRFRLLRQPLAPLVRAHRQHVDVLEGEVDEGAGTDLLDNAAAALLAVRRSERRLHATVVDAAERAESGALARLLASISASVTQHLSMLPATRTTP